ncbi:MAG: DUF1844 domain-containing protein, partial [Thermoanaerobaculia bacterium]|nr:DUF1844 domain-containing protein [Thermoanaerobaculia bacterium]
TEEGDLREPDSLAETETESATPEATDQPRVVEEKPDESEAAGPESDAGQDPGEPQNPGTMFTGFLDSLVVNAYMALGMVRHPYRTEQEIDVEGARQMIDIIEMLGEKTKGNLSDDEENYLKAHLGELKLAFVRRSQSLG